MLQFVIIASIVFIAVIIAEFFIIKTLNKKYKAAKEDAEIYKEYVVSANKRFEFMYNYIKEVGKVDDWKLKELQRLQKEDNKEDVIADIINANNSRVQNNTDSSKS